MPQRCIVHMVNIEKRVYSRKIFRTIDLAQQYVKSHPKKKSSVFFVTRYDEVLTFVSDIAPVKIYHRDPDFIHDEFYFENPDNYSLLFKWTSSESVPRFT